MSVFIDLTEFISAPHRTGIQRVCGELCRAWPATVELTPLKMSRARGLVALPKETLGLVRSYFEASEGAETGFQARLIEVNQQAECSDDVVQLTPGCKILVPEVFYDHNRVAFFRNLDARSLDHFYFILFDLLPLTHPQYFAVDVPHEVICGYFQLIRRIRNVSFISKTTAEAYYRRLLRSPRGGGVVFRLGSDGLGPRNVSSCNGGEKRFTVIGTIEPRKNHALILEVFEGLFQLDPDLRLLFLGRMGWVDRALAEKIRTLSSARGQFLFCEDPDDGTMRREILASRASIFISSAEGFGLPAVESLWLGVPVIASSCVPSLEEYWNLGIHRVDPVDANNLRNAAMSFLDDSYHKRKALEASQLALPTWDSFAEEVAAWVEAEK